MLESIRDNGSISAAAREMGMDYKRAWTLLDSMNQAFTEPVVSKDRTLFRARFAGLDRDQAEAVCRTLKRADISCMTVRN